MISASDAVAAARSDQRSVEVLTCVAKNCCLAPAAVNIIEKEGLGCPCKNEWVGQTADECRLVADVAGMKMRAAYEGMKVAIAKERNPLFLHRPAFDRTT